jgi:S1-C subfamily serine protease
MLQVARVTLLDPQGAKRDYLASVVGLLRAKDLAVLKIDAPPSILQPAVIGTSADVRVGQQVLAIGNPFGFDHTLTTGAISGLDRVIQSQVGAPPSHLRTTGTVCGLPHVP